MNNRTGRHETVARPDQDAPKWFGEPVCVSEGPPDVLMKLAPRFDRRAFAMSSVGSRSLEDAAAPYSSGSIRSRTCRGISCSCPRAASVIRLSRFSLN
jgi:hypothetical protein